MYAPRRPEQVRVRPRGPDSGATARAKGRSDNAARSIWSGPSPSGPAPVSTPPGAEFRLVDTPARTDVADVSGVGDTFAPYLFGALMITVLAIVIGVIAGGSDSRGHGVA